MNIYIIAISLIIVALVGVVVYKTFFFLPPTPQADRLFSQYGREVYELAQRIEQHRQIASSLVDAVIPQVNNRFGENNTLLLFATYMNNPAAAAVLLQAGADPLMKSKSDDDGYNYFQLVTDSTRRHPSLRPGGPQFHQLSDVQQLRFEEEQNRIVAAFVQGYLDAGGDPSISYATGIRNDEPYIVSWASRLAMMKYYDAVRLLVQAGLDPWVVGTGNESLSDTSVIHDGSLIGVLAINSENSEDMTLLDELIDAGYFDNRAQAELQEFFNLFGSYAQRGDERSQQIQMIAMRILKRNQTYDASLERDDFGTKAIFKNHWEDQETGQIPWELIRSEQVR